MGHIGASTGESRVAGGMGHIGTSIGESRAPGGMGHVGASIGESRAAGGMGHIGASTGERGRVGNWRQMGRWDASTGQCGITGATGAKLMTTLVNELERRGGRYGLLAICEGGGTANATIIERIAPGTWPAANSNN
ncbi:hypothetical protein CYMTET_20162 [Cymbomonas tetramitiformis]|uniref:Thiolase C-terminal domain-containing protein n=1 Tax=Cymbomonas tetramitiformis TaxID=36881 RepID=A0AAE0G4Q8_9CHLO|nr:hypothetical protein CYMTET_20162 [Cymbomonas tetramitiformis]